MTGMAADIEVRMATALRAPTHGVAWFAPVRQPQRYCPAATAGPVVSMAGKVTSPRAA